MSLRITPAHGKYGVLTEALPTDIRCVHKGMQSSASFFLSTLNSTKGRDRSDSNKGTTRSPNKTDYYQLRYFHATKKKVSAVGGFGRTGIPSNGGLNKSLAPLNVGKLGSHRRIFYFIYSTIFSTVSQSHENLIWGINS